jgi:hypothetical protein
VQQLAIFLHLQHCFKDVVTDVVADVVADVVTDVVADVIADVVTISELVVDKSTTSHFNICKKSTSSGCFSCSSSCFSKFIEIKQYARFLMPTSKLIIIILLSFLVLCIYYHYYY